MNWHLTLAGKDGFDARSSVLSTTLRAPIADLQQASTAKSHPLTMRWHEEAVKLNRIYALRPVVVGSSASRDTARFGRYWRQEEGDAGNGRIASACYVAQLEEE